MEFFLVGSFFGLFVVKFAWSFLLSTMKFGAGRGTDKMSGLFSRLLYQFEGALATLILRILFYGVNIFCSYIKSPPEMFRMSLQSDNTLF